MNPTSKLSSILSNPELHSFQTQVSLPSHPKASVPTAEARFRLPLGIRCILAILDKMYTMAAPRLAAKSTRPLVTGGQMSASALFPYLDSADVHGEFSAHRAKAVPGSIYSDSESSDGDAVEPVDQQPGTEQQNLTSESVDTFLDQIATERLSKMPRSGSQWDRALRDAELFANHVSVYQRMLEEYLPSSKIATASLWTNCRLLLEVWSYSSLWQDHC